MSTTQQASTLHTDILEILDVSADGRYSTTLLNRRLTLAQERLNALLSSLGWSDWLTWVVGVEVRPSNESGLRSIPLPQYPNSNGASGPSWWKYGKDFDASAYAPGVATSEATAPGVFKVLNVYILDSYTAATPAFNYAEITSWSGRTRRCVPARPEEYLGMMENSSVVDWSYENPPRWRLMANNVLMFDRESSVDAGFLIEYVASVQSLSSSDYLLLQPVWAQFLVADVVASLAERDRDFDLSDRYRSLVGQYASEIAQASRARNSSRRRMRDDQTLDGVHGLGQRELRDLATFGPWWP